MSDIVPHQLPLIPEDNETPFDAIRHIDDHGHESWFARELMPLLEYSDWRNFKKVIDRAAASLNNGMLSAQDHIVDVSNMIETGKGAKRRVADFRLSRKACYQIAINGDPAKEAIALAQNYFVDQTRRQELANAARKAGKLKRHDENVTAYQLSGKSGTASVSRVGWKEEEAQMKSAAAHKHEDGKPNYGRLLGEQTRALFDKTKREIVDYLGLLPKDEDTYRDRLGMWATEAGRLSDKEISYQMNLQDRRLSDNEIVAIVTRISRQVAEHARSLAALDRVDFLSGASLDAQGRALIVRNVRLLGNGER